ncbi:MAG: glycoside hydrolase family 13 protein [Bacteroidales bacterium]|nr:glycoside hydrolase family 13 protein [Bacteroidales bacterium]
MQKNLVLALLALILSIQISKPQSINRVEPLNWWVGMKNQNLQLMIYGKNIGGADVKVDYAGVKLVKINRVSNQNYLFLDLFIDETAHAGNFDIKFTFQNRNTLKYSYSLFQRKDNSSLRNGFSSKDVVYLIMPDRFANGDTLNDNVTGYADKLDRENQYGRHGGDIQGIINHLDYFNDLGVTTLWLTPVLENNQAKGSYHGYSITDYYKVDPRHGSNELYKLMIEKVHQKDLKVVMDMVFNHCGSEHWWMNDLPSEDWINVWPEYTSSNFRATVLSDPYASDYDIKKMSKGWFVSTMPDLNQENPFLANYLTQNSIWWIEFADLDGIRMDTYPFSEKKFMARWAKEVMTEYPNFNIVAEEWFNDPSWCAYWQKDANNRDGYNSEVPSIMDFPLMFTMQTAFDDESGWDKGITKLYNHLSKDFLYSNPNKLLVFADNHDESRFFRANDSISRYKLAMTFLLTTRGIPQIYYGTELLTKGLKSEGDGKLRPDFLGGWNGDNRNAFLPDGRTKKENEAWTYLQTLLKWRKGADVIQNGKLKQFVPEDNIYVYFRYNSNKTVMVILNSNKTEKVLKTDRFKEALGKYSKGLEIISNKRFDILNEIKLAPFSSAVIELIP